MPSHLASIAFPLTHWIAVGLFVTTAAAQYPAENVSLYSRISLDQFAAAAAMDCWGYVSDSGREYALVGLSNGTGFVEITDPRNPVIVGHISHPRGGLDVKVYRHYVYTGSGPLQIIDVGDIDSGGVALVNTLDGGTHNIAVNEESGYLYLALASGLFVLDLSDPVNPVKVGTWNRETHDAQVVSYTDGTYAGREIAFIFSGWSANLSIVDVTDKSNMVRLSRSSYPGAWYTHQGWLSDDRRYLYLDDELDELSGDAPTTRTLVWDVSDLSAPVLINEFTNGLSATDHNLYVRGQFVFEANYKSGMRVWDVSDPLQPVETGFFDTYPANDDVGYDAGAWTAYPFFPSGTVIVSDRQGGLFVLDVSAAVGGRRGDLNCDGAFDGADIEPFLLALANPAAWQAQFPNCDIMNGDMNGDEAFDGLDIDWFFQCLGGGCADCNHNGVPDDLDVANGTSQDCNGNGVPDECEPECNGNGVPDDCDVANGTSQDCNGNGVPDECDVGTGSSADCNANGLPDECENLAPLEITSQPESTVVCVDGRLTLIVVTNRPALRYQWYRGSKNFLIPGATSDTYVVDPVALKDAANYFVILADDCDELTSDVATVFVDDGPTIHVQPTGNTVCVGESTAFFVFATGGSVSYQWRKDGQDIPGATDEVYVIASASTADAGLYDVAVTNDCATVLSDPAVLTVENCFEPGDLNCDGTFDGADIDPFFLALGDPGTYATTFPDCDPVLGDMNDDGTFDGADIDAFFECLDGGVCP